MTVYLVFDVDNLVQHELLEVWATEPEARARCVELNHRDGYVKEGGVEFDEDGECGWNYREVDVCGNVGKEN